MKAAQQAAAESRRSVSINRSWRNRSTEAQRETQGFRVKASANLTTALSFEKGNLAWLLSGGRCAILSFQHFGWSILPCTRSQSFKPSPQVVQCLCIAFLPAPSAAGMRLEGQPAGTRLGPQVLCESGKATKPATLSYHPLRTRFDLAGHLLSLSA